MKFIIVLLIACLVSVGCPTVAPAQVVTTDESGESDNSGGSEANNTSLVLLGAAILVAFTAGYFYMSKNNSLSRAKESPVLLVASTDYEDNVVYDAGDIFSAGLAYNVEF